MRIGSYAEVALVQGTQSFYLASDRLLLKLFPVAREVPPPLVREFRLLRSLECPYVPRAFASGFDDQLAAHYYEMEAGAAIISRLSERSDKHAILQGLANAAAALACAHNAGVAYRPPGPESLLLESGGVTLLYDFTRAIRFDATRMVTPPKVRSILDPPESSQGEYDAVRGDIFGLGAWCSQLLRRRAVQLTDGPMVDLLQRMMADDPKRRPSSMGQVVELVRGCSW
jgi:serine/threonine protein kinase